MKSSYFLYIFCILLLLCSSVQVVSAEGSNVNTTQLNGSGLETGQSSSSYDVAMATSATDNTTTDVTTTDQHPFMHPDETTLQQWVEEYEAAEPVQINQTIKNRAIQSTGSLSLLSNLPYTPAERNQGPVGNCWVWAGTGVLEVAHTVQNGVKDRLSIQYLDSNFNGGSGDNWAGSSKGGTFDNFVDFYNQHRMVVPWSNTNANYQDGNQWCVEHKSAYVSAASIQTTPHYDISSIQLQRIETRGVGQSTAIADIKSVLDQGQAVEMAFWLPDGAACDNFNSFWRNKGESAIWDPSGYTGRASYGHVVVCVGYDDTDPNNRYWILLNSYGTANGNRPHGTFRMKMDLNYDKTYDTSGRSYSWVPATQWMTIAVRFTDSSLVSAYNGPHKAPGTVQAEDYNVGGYNVAYYDTTSGNSGGAYRSDSVDIEAGASGRDVGWIVGGEYLTYSVNAATAGDYSLAIRAANPDAAAKTVTVSTGSSSTVVSVASTGSFDTYNTFTSTGTLHLAAGSNIVKVTFGASRTNFDYFTVGAGVQPTPTTTVAVQPTPIKTVTVLPITTIVVQAEDYNLGGNNVAYYDTTRGNAGGAYRSDDVDIETGASGRDVGWIIGGEYLTYSVNTGAAGDYSLAIRAANPDAAAKTVTVSTGSWSTTVSVASTGSFDTYRTFTSAGTLHLAAGRNVVKVTFGASRMNFDYFTIGAGVQPTTTTTVTVQPTPTITTQPQTGAVSFTASPTSGKRSLTVALTDTTTGGNPVSWKWTCGNGQTFTGKSVGLNRIWYNNAGTYTITLTVTDANGLTRTATKTITVTS